MPLLTTFRMWFWPLVLVLGILLVVASAWMVELGATDINHYECYSLVFWSGSQALHLLPTDQCSFLYQFGLPHSPVPTFHALPFEYPPLTILPFSLPLLAPLAYYKLIFALVMVALVALICWLFTRAGTVKAIPVFLVYLILGSACIFQVRYDLLPATCTLICVLAAERGRWRMSYLALALGALFKIYPIVMLPALFLAEQQAWLSKKGYSPAKNFWLRQLWEQIRLWRWQHLFFSLGIIVLIMGGFALINFQASIVSPLEYFVQRPIQIESVASSLVWLASLLGIPYSTMFTFGSFNILSPVSSSISPLTTLLTVAGTVALLWLQWSRRIDFSQTMVGLVCVLMATGKVFSPQYLIWLWPMLAYVYSRKRISRPWLFFWGAIALLTSLVYAYYLNLPLNNAPEVLAARPGFFALVTLRNLLLVVATLSFICNWWGVRKILPPLK